MPRDPSLAPGAIEIMRSSSPLPRNLTARMDTPEVNRTVAWNLKSEPLSATMSVAPRAPLGGNVEEGFGPGSTVKHASQVPEEPSEFVTVAPRIPAAASGATAMMAFSVLSLTNVVVWAVTPVPGNDRTAPGANPLPRTNTALFLAPWPVFGETELTIGAAGRTARAGGAATATTEARTTTVAMASRGDFTERVTGIEPA
jgi:hypothetical protein